MRKLLFLILLSFIYSTAFSITIKEIDIPDLERSQKETVLHYFYEYENETNKEWTITELNTALLRFQERLERTGWYKDVNASSTIISNEAYIKVSLTEKISYSFWAGNYYLGVSKYDLWGKGKVIGLEAGPIRRKIILEDRMFDYSPLFFSVGLGTEECYYYSYITNNTNTYVQNMLIKNGGDFSVGYILFPDIYLSFVSKDYWLDMTNGSNPSIFLNEGLKLEFDRRAGFPATIHGIDAIFNGNYLYPLSAFQGEGSIQFYQQLSKKLVLAEKVHGGYTSLDVPDYAKFSLRTIDGLRTLSQFSGMIGDNCYDVHAELRWHFWDSIPFFILDMQLEALTFFDFGEARDSFRDFGNPHYVYGGGLRIYIDTFTIRAELGIDETGNSSIITSFASPF